MLKEELITTANLARLKLDESEYEKFNQEITRMIETFSIIEKADVDALPPAIHLVAKENRTREDVPADVSIADRLIENAPEKDGRFIVVPNVL